MSMPKPVMIQPMMIAAGDAPRDMSEGKLKTPPPIMDPTTSAMRGTSVNLCVSDDVVSDVVCTVVMICLPDSPMDREASTARRNAAAQQPPHSVTSVNFSVNLALGR